MKTKEQIEARLKFIEKANKEFNSFEKEYPSYFGFNWGTWIQLGNMLSNN